MIQSFANRLSLLNAGKPDGGGARALASSGSGGSASGSGGHGQLDPCEDNEDLVPTEEPCETAKSWICKETLAFEACRKTCGFCPPFECAEKLAGLAVRACSSAFVSKSATF